MSKFNEGDVVIIKTCQAGTIVQTDSENTWVLLTNGDIWVGLDHYIRFPQDEADLAACPLNVQRLV